MESSKLPGERPLPWILTLTRPFWEAAAKHELVMQKCNACAEYIWYPRQWCTKCGSAEYTWTKMSGVGTVYTYTIIRQVVANSKFFEDKIPFAVGVIQLQEGPRMISNIVGCGLDKITVGMPVTVVFDDVKQGMALPKFEPK